MTKSTKKIMSIGSVKVDFTVNVRERSNYDVPAMKEAILQAGRITDPIHIRSADNVVLRGNRRTLAGQELLADGNTPQEVVEALKKVEVIAHDFVPGSKEELEFILDHGNTKGLSRTEIVRTVWRMDAQFMSEGQIINLLFQPLAGYTGNQQKAVQAAAMTNLRERNEFLRKWLHGTVGNYILAACKMGEYVRQQFILTHLSEDRLLKEGEKVECRMNRDRITQLSAAKTKDSPDKGGKGWTPEQGGENFNAKLEEFKAEDRGEEVAEKSKRPSVKELNEKADVFKSPAIRAALRVAAGDKDAAKGLVDMDDRLHRLQMVSEILFKANITEPNVKALVSAIIGTGPAADVEAALVPFVAKS